jgi:hypothetical protein
MSGPRLEIGPHNCPRFNDLGRGCYLTIPPQGPFHAGYHQPDVHQIRGGTKALIRSPSWIVNEAGRAALASLARAVTSLSGTMSGAG